MKNVTISMKEDLAARARVAAAKQGLSMSTYLRNLLERDLAEPPIRKRDPNNPQHQAIQRILAGPKWSVMENGRMPTAEERNARR
jgi:hypothetical protein